MALTADVKEELAAVESSKTAVRAAELAALLRFSGGLHIIANRIAVESELDSPQIARRAKTWIWSSQLPRFLDLVDASLEEKAEGKTACLLLEGKR